MLTCHTAGSMATHCSIRCYTESVARLQRAWHIYDVLQTSLFPCAYLKLFALKRTGIILKDQSCACISDRGKLLFSTADTTVHAVIFTHP